MVLDSSRFEKKDEVFSMPSDKCVTVINETYYMLSDNVMIVTHTCQNDIIDTFFECDTINEMTLVHNVFFGIWPARKAAQLEPAVALRYE